MKDIFFSKYSFPNLGWKKARHCLRDALKFDRNSITIDNRLDRVGGGLSFPVSVQLLGERIAAEAVSAS